ncbi:hypothetical protein SCACP_21250 [Sporomusa carbonis]|uniref:phage tail protein I n=1 Tax=Sporomusa carbonis TaxID=3076075 RepID=UPI003A6254AB
MANLKDVSLLDLLPPSIRNDTQVQAAAQSLNRELKAVTEAINDVLLISRLGELPETIIDLLAWQWHVDFYDEDFPPIEKKRELIRLSIAWHKQKGTLKVIEEVLSVAFVTSEVVEWFKYKGQPFHFIIRTCDEPPDATRLSTILNIINQVKNTRSYLEAIVGIPDRMLILNTVGPVQAEMIDLSYIERQSHVIFIGSCLGAGAVETVVTNTQWDETKKDYVFAGSRLNGYKLNGGINLNDASRIERVQVHQHTAQELVKQFRNSTFILNASGTRTSTMVDIGHDELITERIFTGAVLNKGRITVSATTVNQSISRIRSDFTGYRLNGNLQNPRLNWSQVVVTPVTFSETKQVVTKYLNAASFSLCGPKTLNNTASYSRQTIVHHPDWQSLIKTEGGHLLNNAPSRTETIEILHPGSKVCKKFNPEIGTVLNGKPSLGYKWKIDLKEAI